MALKSGIRSSEFWLQALAELLAAASAILAMAVEMDPQAKWVAGAVAVVALVTALLGRMGYIANRSALKSGEKQGPPLP